MSTSYNFDSWVTISKTHNFLVCPNCAIKNGNIPKEGRVTVCMGCPTVLKRSKDGKTFTTFSSKHTMNIKSCNYFDKVDR
jgi:hypothetical protein